MSTLAVLAATAAGAGAGWLVGPVADAIATPRYGPGAAGHDPEDLELALLPAPTTATTRGVTAAAVAAAAGLLASRLGAVDAWLYFAALAWACAVACVVDLQYLRLPDLVTWPAAAVALAGGLAICAREGEPGAAVVAALAACAMAAVLFVAAELFAAIRGQEAFGLGDIKLELSLGTSVGWLGWSEAAPVVGPVRFVLVAAVVGMAAGALAGLPAAGFRLRRPIPFGPFLVLGWLVVVLLADELRI